MLNWSFWRKPCCKFITKYRIYIYMRQSSLFFPPYPLHLQISFASRKWYTGDDSIPVIFGRIKPNLFSPKVFTCTSWTTSFCGGNIGALSTTCEIVRKLGKRHHEADKILVAKEAEMEKSRPGWRQCINLTSTLQRGVVLQKELLWMWQSGKLHERL